MTDTLAVAHALLFVPGDRPDRFAKATVAGADGIVPDLEDAVAPDNKPAAGAAIADWLAQQCPSSPVRSNAAGTPWFADDLEVVAKQGCPVVIAKAEDRGALDDLGLPVIIPLVETAVGVLNAAEICSTRRVVRAAFGSVDLAAQLDISADHHQALAHARSAVVLGSAAVGVAPPLDGLTTNLSDNDVPLGDMREARRLGDTSRLRSHPRQIQPLHALLAPTVEEIARAEKVLAVGGDGAAEAVDGAQSVVQRGTKGGQQCPQ
jgi:citrate lyase subunit beta/citryl-CoA lyase